MLQNGLGDTMKLHLLLAGMAIGMPFDARPNERQSRPEDPSRSSTATSHSRFESSGLHLMSWLPLSDFGIGAANGSDCWGYTSPSGREYALMQVFNGTGFVEVTDPGDAQLVGFVIGPSSSWRDVKVYQEYAYAINESGGGIQVIDMSQIDSGFVSAVQTVDTPGTSSTHNVAINEESGFLYRLGGGPLDGLRAYDLATPELPVFVGEWQDRYVHDAQIVNYDSGPFAGREIAFTMTGDNSGGGNPALHILDVTDKANIAVVSATFYSPPQTFSHQGWLSTDRRYFFVNDELDELANGTPTAMYVYDVSDLTAPFLATTYFNGNTSIDHNVYTKGDLIYAANYRSGLRIYDATDPLNLQETAYFDTYPADDFVGFNGLWSNYPYYASGTIVGSDINRGLFVWREGPAELLFDYPQGLPDAIHPDGETLQIQITEQGATLDESTLRVWATIGGQTTPLVPTPVGGGLYEVLISGGDCPSDLQFRVSGTTTDGVTWHDPEPGTLYAAEFLIDQDVTATDDLENTAGWTVGAPGDTATTGIWTLVDPVGTAAQPEDDHTDDPGNLCWVTGQGQVGGTVFANDIDGGATTLTSPPFDLSNIFHPKMGYWRWFSNEQLVPGATVFPNDDVFVVQVSNNGTDWVNVETVGPAGPETNGGWFFHEFRVRDFVEANATVQLRFVASDAGAGGSIVEAAIDDIQIVSIDCGFNALPPAAVAGDPSKNRYVSFVPNNADLPVAFEVALPDGRQGWVGEPASVDWIGLDESSVSLVVDAPVVRVWDEPVINLTGCAIVPDETYPVRASDGDAIFTQPLVLGTVPDPSVGSWADIVGTFDSGQAQWTLPNGFVNFNDVNAAISKFQATPSAPHVSVVDLHPQWPNYFINFSDIDMVIKGFQSIAYPVPLADCQTVANCPLGDEAACLP